MNCNTPRRLPVPPIPQGTSFVPDHRWCFTDAEAKLFETLVRNPIATQEMIAPLLPSCAEFIEGITRKVGPFGVQILPERNGWELIDRLGFWHYFSPADAVRHEGSK